MKKIDKIINDIITALKNRDKTQNKFDYPIEPIKINFYFHDFQNFQLNGIKKFGVNVNFYYRNFNFRISNLRTIAENITILYDHENNMFINIEKELKKKLKSILKRTKKLQKQAIIDYLLLKQLNKELEK